MRAREGFRWYFTFCIDATLAFFFDVLSASLSLCLSLPLSLSPSLSLSCPPRPLSLSHPPSSGFSFAAVNSSQNLTQSNIETGALSLRSVLGFDVPQNSHAKETCHEK